jgi:mRNA interferase RelE/StbE
LPYRIEVRRVAEKQLLDLDDKTYRAVSKTIEGLATKPRPAGVKKIVGAELWRVRVGNYRVVYQITDQDKKVTIVRVVKRDERTYEGL